MAVDVQMPLLGDVMEEGTLVEWLQPDGAPVTKGEPIYRLETEKVSLDVEAPAAGVLRHLVAAGAVVPVHGLLGRILAEGETEAAVGLATNGPPAASAAPVPVQAPAPTSAATAGEILASPAARRLARELGVDIAAVAKARAGARLREEDVRIYAAGPPAAPAVPEPPAEIRASPAARRLAHELGVDIAAVARARRGARLREEDVRAYSASAVGGRTDLPPLPPLPEGKGEEFSVAEQAPATPPELGGSAARERGPGGPSIPPAATGTTTRPLAGRRKVIAQRMLQSVQQMAQLTLSAQVDLTECARLREQLQRLWADDAARPTYADFVLRAAALALREHPDLNAMLEHDTLTLYDAIDVGLAVDATEGLIVPVLRGVDRLALRELTRLRAEAAERARLNRLGPDELQGGTFTVTTLGGLGIDFFTPIVNPPQVAILGVGRVFPQLARVAGEIVERQVVYLSLSFDHRALDGAPAARFLGRVKELLELPVGLL